MTDRRHSDDQLPDEPDTYDHAGIKALAKALGRTMASLTVLQRDPFTADGNGGNRGGEGRIGGAQWFAELYERLGITDAHQRRIHYRIVSQDPKVMTLVVGEYINTEQCETVLERTSLDARYLELVPAFGERWNASFDAPISN